MMQGDDAVPNSKGNVVSQAWKRLQQIYQKFLDDITPYALTRWLFAAVLIIAFLARVFLLQGWYIITYALGIYHLNLFIAFITPKVDPADEYEDEGPQLPTRANEEFRPFIRRLPEFKFWHSVTRSSVFGIICTFFNCFNIPVFWPILVVYFITLLCITMRKQIQHMIRYRYLPFSYGKPKYQGHEDSGKSENVSLVPGAVREE
ncbi:protein RER1 [Cryptotermes secundus]|uniref:protein RER1 n=1 Tax=Cryptotermes secundus TaxID=105785 RepID=UPI000CD7CD76|nr:protein RER1 [Cryptotermes secundus]XP_023722345.1 protein RER1 [Cryptotermes secundus]